MLQLPVFHSQDLTPALALILTCFGYLTYWYLARSPKLLNRLFSGADPDALALRRVLWLRLIGVLFLGLVPAMIFFTFTSMTPGDVGVSSNLNPDLFYWTGSLGFIVAGLTYIGRNNSTNLENYPMIRIHQWGTNLIFLNTISSAGFLLAYEFLFRGILFFSLYAAWGFWPATIINIIIYSLVHFPKSAMEAIGAVPFGLLLCIVTFTTGTIWAAVLIHLIMALSNDFFAFQTHPDFSYKK